MPRLLGVGAELEAMVAPRTSSSDTMICSRQFLDDGKRLWLIIGLCRFNSPLFDLATSARTTMFRGDEEVAARSLFHGR